MLQANTVMNRAVAEDPGRLSLGQQLDSRLRRLFRSIGQEEKVPSALRVAAVLGRGWRDEPIAGGPHWPSDITDDHSPFEFSLALDGRSETLRLLTEPQDALNPSLQASWRMANEIHEELALQWGASLQSYEQVADLFAPGPSPSGQFSIWHSAILGDSENPEFKVYLNPKIHGTDDAAQVLNAGLGRLGLGELWSGLTKNVLRRGRLDEPVYFSLDLSNEADARVKVYVAHHNATARELTAALALSPGFDARRVEGWLEHLVGGLGPYTARPPITCFALRRGSIDMLSTTLHLPVRCYLAEDFEIARRVCGFLGFAQRVRYMRALTGLAERPLESGRGLQTYASLRASPGRQAVTVYLAPQVYSTKPTTMDESVLQFFNSPERVMLEHAS
jgi:DMATS type aromatic prenyltransferase